MAVSKRTRFEVLKRDNFTCRYCRETEGKMTVDHVLPTALGGTDEPDNLVAACADCNAGKASTSPTEEMVNDVKSSDAKWAEAIKRAAEMQAAARGRQGEYVKAFVDAWPRSYMPQGYESSLASLYEAGLPVSEMLDAIEVAFSAIGVDNRFRYFCGVSWRKVRAIQEIAKSLLEVDGAAS